MSTEQHMPGLWTVEREDEWSGEKLSAPLHTIWSGKALLIARTCFAPNSASNARLIASSPVLLAALKALAAACNGQGPYPVEAREMALAAARAAIALAEQQAESFAERYGKALEQDVMPY